MTYSIHSATAAQLTLAEVDRLSDFFVHAADRDKTDDEIKNAYDQASSALDKLHDHRGHVITTIPVWDGLKNLGGRGEQTAATVATASRAWIGELGRWAKPLGREPLNWTDKYQTMKAIRELTQLMVAAPEPVEGSTVRAVARAAEPYLYPMSLGAGGLGFAIVGVALWGPGLFGSAVGLLFGGFLGIRMMQQTYKDCDPATCERRPTTLLSVKNQIRFKRAVMACAVIVLLTSGVKALMVAGALIGCAAALIIALRAVMNFRTSARPDTRFLERKLTEIGSGLLEKQQVRAALPARQPAGEEVPA
ncbi:MAG: hypothetical protein ACOYKZ_05950 [Chlamydiia bacterium]